LAGHAQIDPRGPQDRITGQDSGQPCCGVSGAPWPGCDGKPAAMTLIIDILTSLFSFDIIKLGARLDTLEDRKNQILLVLFTLVSDSIRFFLVTCLFFLILY
jgi:hypothetical protein